jgi:hypothetical protein
MTAGEKSRRLETYYSAGLQSSVYAKNQQTSAVGTEHLGATHKHEAEYRPSLRLSIINQPCLTTD